MYFLDFTLSSMNPLEKKDKFFVLIDGTGVNYTTASGMVLAFTLLYRYLMVQQPDKVAPIGDVYASLEEVYNEVVHRENGRENSPPSLSKKNVCGEGSEENVSETSEGKSLLAMKEAIIAERSKAILNDASNFHYANKFKPMTSGNGSELKGRRPWQRIIK